VRTSAAAFGPVPHRALLAVGATRLTGTRAAARGGGPALLLDAARASDARATTVPAGGAGGVVASSIAHDRVERGQPRAQTLQTRPFYPATRRTAGRGRRTDLASHQSYQSAGSPTIDYPTPLYNLEKYRSGARGCSLKYHARESCVWNYVPRPMEYARSDHKLP